MNTNTKQRVLFGVIGVLMGCVIALTLIAIQQAKLIEQTRATAKAAESNPDFSRYGDPVADDQDFAQEGGGFSPQRPITWQEKRGSTSTGTRDNNEPRALKPLQNALMSAPARINRGVRSASVYMGEGAGHWIESVMDDGSIIKLEDGTLWMVSPLDIIDSALWLPISEITVVDGNNPVYPFRLINTDDNEIVNAKLIAE
jgi:hypothetical protein